MLFRSGKSRDYVHPKHLLDDTLEHYWYLEYVAPGAALLEGELVATRSRQIAPNSETGWMVPISLFAAMIETRTVSGRRAWRRSSGDTRPSRSTGSTVNANPSLLARYSQGWRTA